MILKKIALQFALLISCFSAYAQYYQRQVLTDPVNTGNGFGLETLSAGDTIFIPNYYNDVVYVYAEENGIWNLVQQLSPGDFTGDKYFGYKMSVDGNNLIVGASHDNDNTGAVYFFHRSPDGLWEEVTKIVSPVASTPSSDAYWGGSLINIRNGIATAGRSNGLNSAFHVLRQKEDFTWELWETLSVNMPDLIGAGHITDSLIVICSHSLSQDCLFFFTLKPDGEWSEPEKVFPAETKGVTSIASSIDGDEDLIVAASPRVDVYTADDTIINAGAAFIFEKVNGIWTNTHRIVSPNPRYYDQLGYDVAVDNGRIFLGAVYEDFNENETDSLTNAGAVFVAEKDESNWNIIQKLVPSSRKSQTLFGRSVSVHNGVISIGSNNRYAYIFHSGEDCTGLPAGEAFYDICGMCAEGSSGNEESSSMSNCVLAGTKPPMESLFSISPNPFTISGFTITSEWKIESLTLSTLSGHSLFEGNQASIAEFSKQLIPGVYVIRVRFENGNTGIRKAVKF